MATITLKRTARILTETVDVTYQHARALVSEAVNELHIDRVQYNENLRSWEIATADANMLIKTLSDNRLRELGQLHTID